MNVSATALTRALANLPAPERPGQIYRVPVPRYFSPSDPEGQTAPFSRITLIARAVWLQEIRHLEWFLNVPVE